MSLKVYEGNKKPSRADGQGPGPRNGRGHLSKPRCPCQALTVPPPNGRMTLKHAERCRSGRSGLSRKQLKAQVFREFESRPLRSFGHENEVSGVSLGTFIVAPDAQW